jgi:hypothetical protein
MVTRLRVTEDCIMHRARRFIALLGCTVAAWGCSGDDGGRAARAMGQPDADQLPVGDLADLRAHADGRRPAHPPCGWCRNWGWSWSATADASRLLDVLRRHCDDVGRDEADIHKTFLYQGTALGAGDVDTFAKEMADYAKLGFETVMVMPAPGRQVEWISDTCAAAVARLADLP